MPQVDEDVLVEMYDKIAHLEEENGALKKEFISLKIKFDKSRAKNIFSKKVMLVLAVLLIVLSIVFLLLFNKGNQEAAVSNSQNSLQKKDSFKQKEAQPLIYKVQFGVYENLNIDVDDVKGSQFTKVLTAQGNAYQIGRFTTYKNAVQFKQDLIKVGFKNPFIVAYHHQKKISVKDALVLSKE